MLKGYYALTSGILTQNKKLNTIGNNISNGNTPGYKEDELVPTTFKNIMMYRTGKSNKSNPVSLGESSMITTVSDKFTNYKNGSLKETKRSLDFAISGEGFFKIQTDAGEGYTRNGSFSLDDEGYLYLMPLGRVMGINGPINLQTDDIIVDDAGKISAKKYDGDYSYVDQLSVVKFNDNNALKKDPDGLFRCNDAGVQIQSPQVRSKCIESSNVDLSEQMIGMLGSQRSLQSCSQLIKIYDQIINRSVNEIGKI